MSDELIKQETSETTAAAAETETKKTGKKKAPTAPGKPRGKKKKFLLREVPQGRAYIQATYNNTLVTITDGNGNVLAWSSAGSLGFRGPKKSTPYAASVVVKNVTEKAAPFKVRDVAVYVKGVGSGRDAAIRALSAHGLNVLSIKDITPIPHNGVRPPKVRRV